MENNILRTTASRLARLLPVLLVSLTALAGWSCKQEADEDGAPYIYFKPDKDELTFTLEGGEQQYEMYTNQGPWVVQPEFAEDAQWIDVWPKEGNKSGRFTITVLPNEDAYTRYATIHVVVNSVSIASFTVTQDSSLPYLELDMGSNTLTSPSGGSTLTVPIKANLGWKAEVLGDAAGWIEVGTADDFSQVLKIKNNAGAERRGEVKFSGIGTNYEGVTTSVFIKQFDTSKDPYNGTKKTVAEVLSAIGESEATINRNEWIEVSVVSDRSKLNLPNDIMFVQDESGRGMMLQFVSPRENIYNLNDKIKVHLYEASFVRDPESKALKFYPFQGTSVFGHDSGAGGVDPVVVNDLSTIDNYENTLVTLPEVEFVVPIGSYVNMDETKYAQEYGDVNSIPYHDGNEEHGQILRDRNANMITMYSRYTFLDRFTELIPEGSGAVTGIVTRRTKNDVTSSCLRIRSHADNKVSKDKSTRLSKTHTQFGPFIGRDILTQVNPEVGSGQLKTTQWENVTTQAGTSIDWGWSYARRVTATITVSPDGTQSANPQLSSSTNQQPIERMFSCLSCQMFWNYTGSTMNREGMGPDDLGEAWVFIFKNVSGVSGDLYLDFTYSSSATGPMYYSIEWSDKDTNPISQWTGIETGVEVLPQFTGSNFIAPEWNYSPQLKQFSYKLPDELKSKTDFTIRIRATYNWRASNSGSGIAAAGAPRTSFVALREVNQ